MENGFLKEKVYLNKNSKKSYNSSSKKKKYFNFIIENN
jgi:hypothetical protein